MVLNRKYETFKNVNTKNKEKTFKVFDLDLLLVLKGRDGVEYSFKPISINTPDIIQINQKV